MGVKKYKPTTPGTRGMTGYTLSQRHNLIPRREIYIFCGFPVGFDSALQGAGERPSTMPACREPW